MTGTCYGIAVTRYGDSKSTLLTKHESHGASLQLMTAAIGL